MYIFHPSSQGPGPGPGAGPGPGPGACEEGWKMFFFSNGLPSRDSTHTAPTLQLISGPCSIEKVSSRMANRYTRIFDAGGLHVELWSQILGELHVHHLALSL